MSRSRVFIAGAIAAFVGQATVMKYLGAGANKVLAAACSCSRVARILLYSA